MLGVGSCGLHPGTRNCRGAPPKPRPYWLTLTKCTAGQLCIDEGVVAEGYLCKGSSCAVSVTWQRAGEEGCMHSPPAAEQHTGGGQHTGLATGAAVRDTYRN